MTRQNRIINQVIRNLPPDDSRYYIECEKSSDTFKILTDRKDDLFRLILNTEKKLSRSDNKAEKVELKRIKNKVIQMLEDLGGA